jgi:hypothetical protein
VIIPQAEQSISGTVICQQEPFDSVLGCRPSKGYLTSSQVKTDVIWSSSGSKEVKQLLEPRRKSQGNHHLLLN